MFENLEILDFEVELYIARFKICTYDSLNTELGLDK